jgi:hypothetical protein
MNNLKVMQSSKQKCLSGEKQSILQFKDLCTHAYNLVKNHNNLSTDEQSDILAVSDYLKNVEFDEITEEQFKNNTVLKQFWLKHNKEFNAILQKREADLRDGGLPIRMFYLKYMKHVLS